jgi:hypothetical protein
MNDIEDFVIDLTKKRNTATVSNPYLKKDVADNLHRYLVAMHKMKGKRILLVGEAPGYKGCGITGIPFRFILIPKVIGIVTGRPQQLRSNWV